MHFTLRATFSLALLAAVFACSEPGAPEPIVPPVKPQPPTKPIPPKPIPFLPARETRIMCVGDSNTHGVLGMTSYRYPLWFVLAGKSIDVDFVGTRSEVFKESKPKTPKLTSFPDYYRLFDRDHQGYNGFRTDEVEGKLPVAIRDLAAKELTPDVCLVLLGTNDVGQLGSKVDPTALHGLTGVVARARDEAPATVFLIASIPPIGPGLYGVNARYVAKFNSALPALVRDLHEEHSPVLLVDIHGALQLSKDMLPDGLHANIDGQRKMAAAFFQALESVFSRSTLPDKLAKVVLQNSDFEDATVADGVLLSAAPKGWRVAPQAQISAGVFNPSDGSYLDAAGDKTPRGASGSRVLSISSKVTGPDQLWVAQTLETTLEQKSYSLSFAVGQRLAADPAGATGFAGYRVELLAGNTVIAWVEDRQVPDAGTFVDEMVKVTPATITADRQGHPLTVRIRTTSSKLGAATDFDNIRLVVE